jgi:hypothetical protein
VELSTCSDCEKAHFQMKMGFHILEPPSSPTEDGFNAPNYVICLGFGQKYLSAEEDCLTIFAKDVEALFTSRLKSVFLPDYLSILLQFSSHLSHSSPLFPPFPRPYTAPTHSSQPLTPPPCQRILSNLSISQLLSLCFPGNSFFLLLVLMVRYKGLGHLLPLSRRLILEFRHILRRWSRDQHMHMPPSRWPSTTRYAF